MSDDDDALLTQVVDHCRAKLTAQADERDCEDGRDALLRRLTDDGWSAGDLSRRLRELLAAEGLSERQIRGLGVSPAAIQIAMRRAVP